ncbi:hypothetical protein F1C16_05120 [Hymenobacter sp. NBH84]|uniref:hypothetical protein n=1 Tax=Hymenobacter sp. NBH84 TaxID=2596915 RepID=UPI0016280330|nr:hypothetical protein [Hymenobacter sp. NBH84]QNE38977.1 hypothetical protein F1C16_05120 [Hymenobacter sp. NBH84]
MAIDLQQIQQLVDNAAKNENVLNSVRKNVNKVTVLMDEINAVLDPSYVPEPKAKKTPAEGAKRPGRPKKVATAE